MSLYNLTIIRGNDALVILQGFNSYANGLAFSIISFAIFMAVFVAVYQNEENIANALTLGGFVMVILSGLLFFAQLVPVYTPFVYLSLMSVGIFMALNGRD